MDVTDNIYLNPGNTSDIIFHCNICGKSFVYNYLLKKHLAKHKKQVNYKTNKCKFCGKQFKLKFGLARHIQKHHNSMRATILSTAPHTNILNKDIISYPGQTKIISNNNSPPLNIKQEKNFRTTLKDTNSSDQMNLANSNESIVLTDSQNSMANILNIKQENGLHKNVKERNNSDQIEHQVVWSPEYPESYPSDANIMLMKEEDASRVMVRDHFQLINNKLQSNVLRHNAISNNNSPALNIKQEINSRTTLRETNSSDQMNLANSNESIVLTASQNSMTNIQKIKQEKNLYTNVRERNNSDQVDSVNSNESILADKPHDLMAEQFPINTVNNNIVSIVRDMPYFCIRKLSNIKSEFCNDDYDQTSQNKLIFTCRICKNSPSTDIHSFALHMSEHRECKLHECIVCDKTFNSVVLWTAHMIYHQQQIDLNVSTVQFNHLETESNTFDPINSRNMEPQVFTNLKDRKCKTIRNTDSATMSRNQKKETKSSSTKKTNFCNFCNRKFTKRCSFTNHMMTKHNINTNTPKQLTSIDCNESIIQSENIKSTDEYKNKLSIPVNNKNNNLNNRVKKSNKKKSTFCILCNKHFAYIGTLIHHMRIHGQQFPCDACEKKFSTPFQLNVHRKSHSEILPYVCTICNKSYKLKYRWNHHLKSHY
ncbi:putative zinc finger protein 840 isoform X2 [Metopolophium dirhodum]|uniref:putative zinc finger protein 840 isoform X2 n=1 Tax=Metopolophium dirhodum TaxID=44670 RepID=UPI00298FD923|nr:putative zinc finger protein 840 isoform X2 [Metopolophium dirhodum]